jgi:hypothetical protein
MSGHTPGPWRVAYRSILTAGMADTFDGPVLGSIATIEDTCQRDSEGREWKCSGSAEANARLIGAAPKLRKALEALVENFEQIGHDKFLLATFDGFDAGAAILEARAAIALTTEDAE